MGYIFSLLPTSYPQTSPGLRWAGKSISHHTWPKSSIISDHPSKYYHNFSDRRGTATDFKYWALNYSPLIIKIYLLQNNAFYSRVQKTAVIIIRVGIIYQSCKNIVNYNE